jgi:hypothetical protein
MTAARRIVLTIALVSVGIVAGCDTAPGPSPTAATLGPSRPAEPSGAAETAMPPLPSGVATDQLGGPWQPSPIALDDRHIAIISDACAATARETLGDTEANLPTALIDARGEGLAMAIMADDLDAIACLVNLDDAGTLATVDAVDRLSSGAVAPVEGTEISVASAVRADDRDGGRTIAFGRIGPRAEAAKVGFDDGSAVVASYAEGWWATWWPGSVRAGSYSAVDAAGIVIGSAQPFDGEREARVGPATWWVDPQAAPLPTTTTIRALVRETACASGRSPEGRVEPPRIDVGAEAITVTFDIRKLPGGQDCQGNAPFPVTITLPEPLGNRTLLDGGVKPPRDAMTLPG